MLVLEELPDVLQLCIIFYLMSLEILKEKYLSVGISPTLCAYSHFLARAGIVS